MSDKIYTACTLVGGFFMQTEPLFIQIIIQTQKIASPFLGYVREFMVSRRYAKRTVETYLYWIRLYILFHHKQHPNQLSDTDVESFLSYLSNQRTNFIT